VTAAALTMSATVSVTASFTDTADASDTDSASDAAVSIVVVDSTSKVEVLGNSTLAVSGDVGLNATTNLSVTSTADGSGGTAGGTVAITTVSAETIAQVSGSSSIVANDSDLPDAINIGAALTSNVSTTAKSTAGGAEASNDGTNESEQQLANNNAETSEGAVSFAGSVVVTVYAPVTQAIIDTSGSLATAGDIQLTAAATETITTVADASNTGSGGTGVGVAVAIGVVSPETRAILDGLGSYTAQNVTLSATLAADNTYKTEAKSGIGDSSKTGVAGSLAINVVTATVEALVRSGAAINLNGSNLSLAATSQTKTETSAVPHEDGVTSESLGIGASVALTITDNQTLAAIEDLAELFGADAIALSASGTHKTTSTATGGAKATDSSATVATPVVAMTFAFDQTAAILGSGAPLILLGDLGLTASHDSTITTKAEGDAEGGSTTLRASFALTIDEQTSLAGVLRSVTTAGGAVALASTGLYQTRSESKAAAAGASDNGGSGDGVDQQNQAEAGFGSNQANSRTGNSTTNSAAPDASTSDGSISAAAAISLALGETSTFAFIADGVAIIADGSVSITSAANSDSAATADGSAANGSSGTVGAAVAINSSTVTNRASLGASTITANGLTVSATMADRSGESPDRHEFSATSESGASGGNVGVAGSFALNLGTAVTEAILADGATVTMIDGSDSDTDMGSIALLAESSTKHEAKAEAAQEKGASGDSIGVGASVAITVGDNDTHAVISGEAVIDASHDVTVLASGSHTIVATASGGAAGGTAVTPVVAIAVGLNDTTAEIATGTALTIGGDLSVTATHRNDTASAANGASEGTNAAIGASLALTIAEDSLLADLARSVEAGGAVLVSATSRAASHADAKASAAGASEDNGSNSNGAQTQSDAQVGQANDRSGGTGTNNAPSSDTSSGSVSVAAAIGINVAQSMASKAVIGGEDGAPITVVAQGGVAVRSSANHDAAANADGSAVTKKDGTSIGAAVAVNASNSRNHALIEHASVTGDGVIVEADMAIQEIDVAAVDRKTVVVADNTIFVGAQEELKTGEEVVYKNGGGDNIGALTDGTTYFVIKGDKGLIKLAATASDAADGTAIDLTSQGSGTAHVLERTGNDNITFDPAKSRFEIDLDQPQGLATGEAVVYSNGGGDNIGGLTDGTTYFAIVEGDGLLRLGETRDKALKNEAIELTSVGTGSDHKITSDSHAAVATAKSGAGGGKIGVAGSVAINVAQGDTTAMLGDDAVITAEDGWTCRGLVPLL